MGDKKGYLKTFEAVVALLILLGVILYSLSLRQNNDPIVPEDIKLAQDTAISKIENDRTIRIGMISSNCSLTTVVAFATYMGELYPTLGSVIYTTECDEFYNGGLSSFAPVDRDVYTTSVILFDNSTDVRTVVVKIWRKGV